MVEFIYLVFTRMPGESYVGLSNLWCCVSVTDFKRQLTPLFVDSVFSASLFDA